MVLQRAQPERCTMEEGSVRPRRTCSSTAFFFASLGPLDTHHTMEVWNRECGGERTDLLDSLRLTASQLFLAHTRAPPGFLDALHQALLPPSCYESRGWEGQGSSSPCYPQKMTTCPKASESSDKLSEFGEGAEEGQRQVPGIQLRCQS